MNKFEVNRKMINEERIGLVIDELKCHTTIDDKTALIAARISVATGYPDTHYGGVGWVVGSRQNELRIALPGGGMIGEVDVGYGIITLHICSFGNIERARIVIRAWYDETEITPIFEPRKRDLARARMWAAIARGTHPSDAARAEGLGSNIGHAHAGRPAEPGEEPAYDTAIRLITSGERWRVGDIDQVLREVGRRTLGIEL